MSNPRSVAIKRPPASSTEKSVVKVGPKHVSIKNKGIRNEKGERPTTERALILRHGKYGAFGTGELVPLGKMTGREKLDLLAEDLADRASKAVAAPFSLEKCLKLAESQCNAYLDDIRSLHDPEFFCSIMQAELNSRYPPAKGGKPPPLKNPTEIASLAGARIHNSYTLASAWRLILYALIELGEMGLIDCSSNGAKGLLKGNNKVRERFLNVYDLVKLLVDILQKQFASLAAVTPHYAIYFKAKPPKEKDDPEDAMEFDWTGLRIKNACKSFIDSIIIELCFPQGSYPKGVLYQILHDAVEEAPHHAKRFPQALWDAVGDLSISVELLDLLDSPLLSPEGREWKTQRRQKPASFDQWLDAQLYSLQASDNVANWKDLIFPLEKTKSRVILESMWKNINMNYRSVSGKDLNVLWNLEEALIPNPSWHAYDIPMDDLSDEEDSVPTSVSGGKKPLRLTLGNDNDDSMPDLLSVSDSDSEEDIESDDAGSEYGESDRSDYNTDEEDELREMLKEAMNQATNDEFLESIGETPPADQTDDRKNNPFLKLLGSLRGRLFSASAKLKADGVKPGAKAGTASGGEPGRKTADGHGDDDVPAVAKTKKKKKPKKKKKKKSTTAGADDADAENEDDEDEVAAPELPVPSPAPAPSPPTAATVPTSLAIPLKSVKPSPQPPTSPSGLSNAYGSTTSLALPVVEKAQSAHSYLKETGMASAKTKTKTRGESLATLKEKSQSVLSRFGLGKDKNKDESKEDKEKVEKTSKAKLFDRLTKKGKASLETLLRINPAEKPGDLKWEHFLRAMRELGFDYDPSTAGSSVRFDPPDPRDKPITFHKPHPDPTLTPGLINEYGKRLKDHYGWTKDLLQNQLDEAH